MPAGLIVQCHRTVWNYEFKTMHPFKTQTLIDIYAVLSRDLRSQEKTFSAWTRKHHYLCSHRLTTVPNSLHRASTRSRLSQCVFLWWKSVFEWVITGGRRRLICCFFIRSLFPCRGTLNLVWETCVLAATLPFWMACSFPWSCGNFRSVSHLCGLKMTSLPKALTDNDAGSGFICICLQLALQFGLWWDLVCFIRFWWGNGVLL